MKHIDMEPLRKCKECGVEAYIAADLHAFAKEKKCPHGRRNLCTGCANTRSREYKVNNPEKTTLSWRTSNTKRYGISLEEYESRMATSDKCECCDSKENLCYDHCHESMAFRGVLCRGCNAAIGGLGDTEEGVLKALTYLINHRERQNEVH